MLSFILRFLFSLASFAVKAFVVGAFSPRSALAYRIL